MGKKITADWVWQQLPPRSSESNKGTYGKALLVAGSTRYRGAAALCAEGAARAGAGIVTLAAIQPVLDVVLPRLPEICQLPCPTGAEGGISAAALPEILAQAKRSSVLAIGPGLSVCPETQALVPALIEGSTVPVVLDADGLNLVSTLDTLPHPENAPLILTPHPGEMARLTRLSIEEIQANRENVAVGYARAHQCIVVLKGHVTLIAGPDGSVYQNTTGNPGLARGGSGDVLTGILTALVAQKVPPLEAAACGVWLHGAAADRTALRLGQYGMLPHDIFADLGQLFAQAGR